MSDIIRLTHSIAKTIQAKEDYGREEPTGLRCLRVLRLVVNDDIHYVISFVFFH